MIIQNLQDFRVALARLNTRQRGDAFERLVKSYLIRDPQYKNFFQNVWLLKELPTKVRKHLNLPKKDIGIDLIAQTKANEFWAIQAKYKSSTNSRLNWKELSTFHALAFEVSRSISAALVCSTAIKFSRNAKELSKTQYLLNDLWSNLDAEYFVDVSKWLDIVYTEQVNQVDEQPLRLGENCYWCGMCLYGEDHHKIWFCGWQGDWAHREFYFAHIECIPSDYKLLAPISGLCTNEGFTRLRNTLAKGSFTYQNYSDLYTNKRDEVIQLVELMAQELNMFPQYYDNGLAEPTLNWWNRNKADTVDGITEVLHSVCGVEIVKTNAQALFRKRNFEEFENKYGGKGKFKEQIEKQIERYEAHAKKSQLRLEAFISEKDNDSNQYHALWLPAYERETDLYRNALTKTIEANDAYEQGKYEESDQQLHEAWHYAQSAGKIFD